ncbi:TPA: hypothetical protein N0F65_002154 [Lagenidium giganteum]|uniref:Phosphatidylserine synthase n=1 Tax=Lagenidium giganteum TaxID=4803 RepID=A0AAV2YQ08_9STRA|nr:TPA: hypothetical protein N0F65_002154 [Lagenidium giganteum]
MAGSKKRTSTSTGSPGKAQQQATTLARESESDDGFVSPATRSRLQKSIWTNAKKRLAKTATLARQQQQQQQALNGHAADSMDDPLSLSLSAAAHPRGGHPEMPSPSVGTYSHNTFRAAKDNDVENLLLFREQPRQLFVLGLVVSAVSYYSFTHDSKNVTQNVRTGLSAATLIFLVYCFLQTRDGLLVRPHPGLWRVVHGISVVYLLMLAAISVQNREGAQLSMQFLFPEVGSLTKSHGPLECEVNADTVYRGVSSIWFLAHVTGWWGKMCLFRDWRFCWVLSIAFELLELAFQFVIPDFQECWWDSLFMDLFGANMLGMLLGSLTLRVLESKEYDWSGKKGRKMGYALFALSQFTPITWSQYHWEVFSSFKRFAQVSFALIVCLLVELNAFFLLNTLEIPKESNFNKYRLTLIFLIGIPGAAEYYEFLSNPECWRLGQNAWMILSIAVFEVLVWVKFSANGVLFNDPPPAEVFYPILAFLVMFAIWMLLFFTQDQSKPATSPRPGNANVAKKGKKKNVPGSKGPHEVTKWGKLDVLFWFSFSPLLLLVTQWAY